MARDGNLSALQALVSLVVITLFMPCLANFLMIVKEFGSRTAVAVGAFILPVAFLVGGLVNVTMRTLGIGL